ncbi:anaphase-promoting complex, cyclosome, subunit 4-domain-containing protein [Thamnocephalis sphaerospora]|uniref:Anaphase-promoting complex subunit 4 n=1 Tax=Thamnocephalis sphaerospora TaxID=78915 RepID=A0A4P9XMA9_9FUNG|nr:anaphase-promoting complex, cyclosome, subunit 4-domain-containing protein [Thamnocephalis sphaerospora]|eukprot:RKP06501.1 anaphase-promoting complex, cyclosome, subunit 4-domain-containing protein [Thamnocephalis sphaerospora]
MASIAFLVGPAESAGYEHAGVTDTELLLSEEDPAGVTQVEAEDAETLNGRTGTLLTPVRADIAQHFHLYSERSLADPALVASWCPRMDVLAVGHVRGDITASRMSWLRAWSRPAEVNGACARCLAWRPDGRVLAVGYSDGTVRLLDATAGGKLLRTVPPAAAATDAPSSFLADLDKDAQETDADNAAITHLYWTDTASHAQASTDPASRAAPTLARAPISDTDTFGFCRTIRQATTTHATSSSSPTCKYSTSDSNQSALTTGRLPMKRSADDVHASDDNAGDNACQLADSPLSLLVIADASGSVRISLNGLFDLAPLSTTSPGDDGTTRTIVDMQTSVDQTYLMLLTTRQTAGGTLSELSRYSLFPLVRHPIPLYATARAMWQTRSALRKVDALCQRMAREHAEYRRQIDDRVRELASQLWRHGEEMTPRAAFVNFMATQSPYGAFEQFFEQHLTEEDVKRWESLGCRSLDSMKNMVIDSLMPEIGQLRNALNSIVVYSRWQRYGQLGLQRTLVNDCIGAADQLKTRADTYSQTLDEEIRRFHEFIQWLKYACATMRLGRGYRKLRPVIIDEVPVLAFLRESLGGEQYAQQEGDVDMEDADTLFSETRQSTDPLTDYFSSTASLKNLLDAVDVAVSLMFSNCARTLCHQLNSTARILLAAEPPEQADGTKGTSHLLHAMRIVQAQAADKHHPKSKNLDVEGENGGSRNEENGEKNESQADDENASAYCFVAYYVTPTRNTRTDCVDELTRGDAIWILRVPCASESMPDALANRQLYNAVRDTVDAAATSQTVQIGRISLAAYPQPDVDTAAEAPSDQYDPAARQFVRVLDMAFFDDETLCLRVEQPINGGFERYLVTYSVLDLAYYSISCNHLPLSVWPMSILQQATSAIDTQLCRFDRARYLDRRLSHVTSSTSNAHSSNTQDPCTNRRLVLNGRPNRRVVCTINDNGRRLRIFEMDTDDIQLVHADDSESDQEAVE